MSKVNKFIGRSFEFYEDARGFYYLKVKEGEDVVEQDVLMLNNWIEEEGSGERKPLLLELAYGSTISSEVQRYLSDNTHRYSTADAILIQTFAHKLLATFYMRHFKPKIPTKVFQDVFEALEWIKTQNDQQAVG
jgi:hypothetical protein